MGKWDAVREKLPFAVTGGIATAINYGLYLLLVDRVLPPVPATMVAYASSVVLNFWMQRRYVFQLRRPLRQAFGWSMLSSLGGLLLDAALIWGLHRFPFFADSGRQWLTKWLATVVVFFYNFYTKRLAFEGRRPAA